MSENKEISALLQLIDDPDQEVFDTVANKILHYGTEIIPNLESLWEETPDETVQERLELLIHRVHYQNLQTDFKQWNESKNPDILLGAMLVARYQYPGLSITSIFNEIDKIKRNIWLELNNYLTPLEQINVLNSMIYSYFGMKGSEISYGRPNQFFINQVIESRKGNAITIGILYQALCQRLDIPVFAVDIPKQFILGFFDHYYSFIQPEEFTSNDSLDMNSITQTDPAEIQFFIDPLQGQVYTNKDVETYLKRISVPYDLTYFRPQTNKNIIRLLLNELSKCYENKKDHYRCEELRNLADMLKP